MKIAIIHEMLIKLGGAERVLETLMRIYPEADIYTLMYNEAKVGSLFPRAKIHCTGPAQWLYKITQKPRASLPFMIFSLEGIDLAGYDLVISSSSGFAHGVNLARKQRGHKSPFHICYCHSPARYLWDWTEQVQSEMKVLFRPLIRAFFTVLRKIDLQASQSPDMYIANSREVQMRIKKYYKRESIIIYPPVDTEKYNVQNPNFKISERKYYVITSALTPFKRVDIPVRVFSKLNIPLKIIGTGDQEAELKKIAGPCVEFLGRLSDEQVVEVYREARGFIMPQKEDAGIAPIEAMAAGLPVFGQAAGGLLETSIDGVTGRFFSEETDESFSYNFEIFDQEIDQDVYDAEKIALHAAQFACRIFEEKLLSTIESLTASHS